MKSLIGVKPYRHQSVAVARGLGLLEEHGSFLLAHEMGAGKTLTSLSMFAQLHESGQAKSMLIVCPKSVVGSWQNECERAAMPFEVVSLALPTAKLVKRLELLHNQRRYQRPEMLDPLVCIINWDMLFRVEAELRRFGFDVICGDEVQKAKAAGSKQSRSIHRIGKQATFRLGLSGTPAPENELEYYGVFRFLDDRLFGTSKVAFDSRFAITIPMGDFNKVVPNRHMLPELERIVHSRSHRVTKREALDLPDEIDVTRTFELSAKARRIYDSLMRESIALIERDAADTGVVVADNVLTKLMRLQQMTSGFTQDNDGEIVWLHDDRVAAMKAEVEDVLEAGGKCLVWHRFVEDGRRISEVVDKLCGSPQPRINGSVDADERREAVRRIQHDSDARVMVLQCQAAATGITATAASTAIWYSFSYSSGEHSQGRARNHRIGSTEPVRHVYLEARDTVDGPHRAAVLGKMSRSDMFLGDHWRKLFGDQ